MTFTGTVIQCLATNSAPLASVAEITNPGSNNAYYYLVRGQTVQFCNQVGPGYTTNSAKEKAGRDTQIIADPTPCP